MSDEDSHRKARAFFDELWARGDPWQLETSEFERAKYARQMGLIAGRRYGRVLEIGCGAGVFTRALAGVADRVVGLDVSEAAIARARERTMETNVDYRVANAMDWDLDAGGPWDLVVMAETVYYLGWLYPFFDVAWLAHRLHRATRPGGGRLLLSNTCGGVDDYLLLPWIIRTYHDLFGNVGFRPVAEEKFVGAKEGATIEALLALFERPA